MRQTLKYLSKTKDSITPVKKNHFALLNYHFVSLVSKDRNIMYDRVFEDIIYESMSATPPSLLIIIYGLYGYVYY